MQAKAVLGVIISQIIWKSQENHRTKYCKKYGNCSVIFMAICLNNRFKSSRELFCFDSVWWNPDLLMGDTKTPHFYDFGIFQPCNQAPKPITFIFGDTRTPNQIQENTNTWKTYYFWEISELWNPLFDISRKDGHRQMMKIRLTKSQKSWIWDQYLPENMTWFFQKYLMPIIYNRIVH